MKSLTIAVAVFAATTILVHAQQTSRLGAPSALQPRPSVDTSTLYSIQSSGVSPYAVTQAQAVESVRKYAPGVFSSQSVMTVRHGLVDLHGQSARSSDGVLRSIGDVNAWAITVKGLDLPRPGGDPFGVAAGIPIPRIHNVTFIVDDHTGSVIQSTWD